MNRLFTSESVTEGHPDKVCDKISDALLDAYLNEDPYSRVAIETLVTTGQVVVAGEVTSNARIEVQDVIRDVIKSIGYTKSEYGFTDACGILNAIHRQSPDIAMGVDIGGAGDQGMMFGGACDETTELMPLPITLAHALTREYTNKMKDGTLPWARPDGKSQVTVRYEDGKPVCIDTIVMSVQHDPCITRERIFDELYEKIIIPVVCDEYGFKPESIFNMYVNPTGQFIIGGPMGDTGVTGRKIIVDTYGGYFSHGGGAFSGKDPTKVDRSGAYAARWIAKNIVAAKLATKCEVQISYAIGVVQPVSVYVNTFGTGQFPDEKLSNIVREIFDLTPKGIIDALDLRKPIYRQLSAGGHMGRTDLGVKWEDTNMIDCILNALK